MSIFSRWDSTRVIFEFGDLSIREAVEKAIADRADLRSANLRRADLRSADLTDAILTDANLTRAILTDAILTGADLTDAILRGADLTGADLSSADLTGADLSSADLRSAYLTDAILARADLTDAILARADLTGADLSSADLTGADLTGADLTDADLRIANLRGADLAPVKADLWMVLTISGRRETEGLVAAIEAGRIDGSTYQGECACLVGTIANVRGCDVPGLAPDSSRPAERWFLAIRPGNTPENHPIAKLTAEWVQEWLSLQPAQEQEI